MKILDDEAVLNFLHEQNGPEAPEMSVKQIQAHLDYKCGCKITQDNKGNSLFPCNAHKYWAASKRDNITLHTHIH